MGNISQNTLISLAILKEQMNNNEDYLSYFNPFVIGILKKLDLSTPINDELISEQLHSVCGLKFPKRIVQLMLKKVSKKGILTKKNGIYTIVQEKLEKQENIFAKTGPIKSQLFDLINNFSEFCKEKYKVSLTEEDSLDAFIQFLSKFSISAIRLSISGTAFEVPKRNKDVNLIYISQYILSIFKTDRKRFEEFEILLKGNMIANSIVSDTLIDTPQTFKNVVFYLDTPIIVELYGLDGVILEEAANELLELVAKIGGKFAVFEHTKQETSSLIYRAAEQYDVPESRLNNKILENLLETGLSKSDLQLKAEKLSEFLASKGIETEEDPDIEIEYCIDEVSLSKLMDEHIGQYREKVKRQDIRSVQNIYQLRKNKPSNRLEECSAVFVTNNPKLASAIHEYGRIMSDENNVSAVITDFSLANMAWLKAPLGACDLQKIELLSMAYLSLQPSNELLQKYLTEIEKLQKDESISDSDYFLLTCQVNNSELVIYTLGNEDALTKETIMSLLERIKTEIRSEESQKLAEEESKHKETKNELSVTKKELDDSKSELSKITQKIIWNSKEYANKVVGFINAFMIFIIIVGLVPQIPVIPSLLSKLEFVKWISLILAILSGLSLLTGFCIFKWLEKYRKHLATKYIRKQEKKLDIKILK